MNEFRKSARCLSMRSTSASPSFMPTALFTYILTGLRREDPVHFFASKRFGEFWSLTKYKDITRVELDHHTFSSEKGITIDKRPRRFASAWIYRDGSAPAFEASQGD